MLIYDFRTIGNNLLAIRKKIGLTQTEVAEKAGLSDRTYADIERGEVNMIIGTFLSICNALNITPDDVLTQKEYSSQEEKEEIIKLLEHCSAKEKETALHLLSVYLHSLN